MCTAICGTNPDKIKFRGSSFPSDGKRWLSEIVLPPNTDPAIREGVDDPPVGETGLEPEGVVVDANSDCTEAFEALYGSEATDEVIDCESAEILVLGLLSGVGLVTDSGGLKGDA